MKKYVTVSIIVSFVILISFFLCFKNYRYYQISGSSMEPTMTDNSRVVIKKTKELKRYDIVNFEYSGEDEGLIKRIIGMPNDPIFIKGNRMVIDLDKEGQFIQTVNVTISSDLSQKWQHLTKIPKDSYFVVGDNVSVSKDSRTIGWISGKQIEGKAIYYTSSK